VIVKDLTPKYNGVMDINSFETLIKQENAARLFLIRSCWKNYRRFCIKCRNYKIYRIVGKKYRCKRCGYTFHDFIGRWINKVKISCKKWLWIIKLFELELSARKISQQVGLSYPTVLKALNTIRMAILANNSENKELLKGKVDLMRPTLEVNAKGKEAGVHSIKSLSLVSLKEMEFRYNNRYHSIFNILVKYITNLVPDLL
jgi:transposase